MLLRPHRSTLFPYTTLFRSSIIGANKPGDETFLVRFISSDKIETVQDFTANKEMLMDGLEDRKSTRLNSSHLVISYAVFCLKKKNIIYSILIIQTLLLYIFFFFSVLLNLLSCSSFFYFFFSSYATSTT